MSDESNKCCQSKCCQSKCCQSKCCGVCCGCIKTALTVLSAIANLAFTVGDLLGCLSVTCLVLHFYVLIASASPKDGWNVWGFALIIAFLAPMTANVLLIPIWHFLQFPYFKEKGCPWFIPFDSKGQGEPIIEKAWNIILQLVAFISLIGFILLLGLDKKWMWDVFDYILLIIIVIIPIFRIILLYAAYVYHFYRSLFASARKTFIGAYSSRPENKRVDPFLFSIYGHNRLFQIDEGDFKWSVSADVPVFDEKGEPEKEDKVKIKNNDLVWEILHIVFAVVLCIVIIVLCCKLGVYNKDYMTKWDRIKSILLAIFIILVIMIPLTEIRFPFFLLDHLVDSISCECLRTAAKRQDKGDFAAIVMSKKGNEKESGWDTSGLQIDDNNVPIKDDYSMIRGLSMIVHGIIAVLICAVTLLLIIDVSQANKNDTDNDFYDDKTFKNMDKFQFLGAPTDPTVNDTKEIVSEMCYVKPYGIKMLQMQVLSDLSYYNVHSGSVRKYLREFFDPRTTINEDEERRCAYCFEGTLTDDVIADCQTDCYDKMNVPEIDQRDFTSNSYAAVTRIQFPASNLTVFSIRGTTSKLDAIMDVQMFLSSALLTLASPIDWFSMSFATRTTEWVRYVVAAPLKAFKPLTVVHQYMEEIGDYVESSFKYNNVLFVGHSLGGGLAKIMSLKTGLPAISLSGPGVKIFSTIVEKSAKETEIALSGMTEMIPDGDVVPLVEVSAGTRYRILCNKGPLCHLSMRSICMTGIMCETEHERFCRHVTEYNYDEMKDLAKY